MVNEDADPHAAASDPDAYPRWQLLQSLYNYSAPAVAPVSAAVTLAGWLPDSAQAIDINADVTRSAVTLVLLEIPLRP